MKIQTFLLIVFATPCVLFILLIGTAVVAYKLDEAKLLSHRVHLDVPWNIAASPDMRIFFTLPKGDYSVRLYVENSPNVPPDRYVFDVNSIAANRKGATISSRSTVVRLPDPFPADSPFFIGTIDIRTEENRSGLLDLHASIEGSSETGGLPKAARVIVCSYNDVIKQYVESPGDYNPYAPNRFTTGAPVSSTE